jgi:tRNA pseudouridine38-40 synthase
MFREELMQRFRLTISYDGTHFCGWQSQKQGRTVQQTLEAALSAVAKVPVSVVGSGRTDAGVHALGQCAHVDLPIEIQPHQLVRALTTKLPHDVAITDAKLVSSQFHARYDAFRRTYLYRLTLQRTPFNRDFCSFMPKLRICPEHIAKVLPYFCGEHDFTSFSKYNPDIKSTLCNVQKCELKLVDNELQFTISANRFLHNMVRRMVGTAVLIGHHGEDPEVVSHLLARLDPSHTLIATAPPQGLYLARVEYPVQ